MNSSSESRQTVINGKTRKSGEKAALLTFSSSASSSSSDPHSTPTFAQSPPYNYCDVENSIQYGNGVEINGEYGTQAALGSSVSEQNHSTAPVSLSHNKTLPAGWEVSQDYRYQNYYVHRPSSLTTWQHPVSQQEHPANSWFKDSYDLPDYDLVQLQHMHRYYYQSTIANQSQYFPYYTNVSHQPNIPLASKQHPLYWDTKIRHYDKVLSQDSNAVLNTIIADIQSGPLSSRHVIQPNKHDTPMSKYQIVCGTVIRNGLISMFSMILWLSLLALSLGWFLYYRDQSWDPANGVDGWSITAMGLMLLGQISPQTAKQDSPMLGFGLCLISAVLVYSIYILSWVWPGMCGWMCCDGPVSGRLGTQDKMMESLKQSHHNQASSANGADYTHHDLHDVKARLQSLESSTPRLWLEVECSHQSLTNRTQAQNRTWWDNIKTLCGFCQGSYYTQTTYVAHQSIPIIYSRDISPSVNSVIRTIYRGKEKIAQRCCVPFNFSVDVHTLFQLHPLQHRYLELLRQRLYYAHSFRDTDTRVLVKYQVGGSDANNNNNNNDSIIDLTHLFSPQPTHSQSQYTSPIVQTFPFMASEDDPMTPSIRVLPTPLQSFRIGQFDGCGGEETDDDGDISRDGDINAVGRLPRSMDTSDQPPPSQSQSQRCFSHLFRGLFFSPLSFIWLHLCLYLPLLMLFRAGTRELPYVNVKYLVIGPKAANEEEETMPQDQPQDPNKEQKTREERIKSELRCGFVDRVELNKPRSVWKWNWADNDFNHNQ